MTHTGAANGPLQAHDGTDRPKQAGKPIRQILREAAQAVQSSPDPASRTYALVEIVKAQARAGDKEGALESARQAATSALAQDPYAQSSALVAIAWARIARDDVCGWGQTEFQVNLKLGLTPSPHTLDARWKNDPTHVQARVMLRPPAEML